jgi:hypothetical protein
MLIILNKQHTVSRGEMTQKLNFKYLYKSHRKSYKLQWLFKGVFYIIKSHEEILVRKLRDTLNV